MESASSSGAVMERSAMDPQRNKLSPQEFQQLKDLITYSNKKLQEVLSEFDESGCFGCYNHDGEVDLDGFRAFIASYLEADIPEELTRHLFLSFLKKKPTHSQQQQAEAEKPSSVTASKEEFPRTDPEADDSTFLAAGTGEEQSDISLEELTKRFRSLKYVDSSDETSDTENTCKQAGRALVSSVKSPSCHGPEEGTSMEMTTRSVQLPFFLDEEVGERGGSAAAPASEEKEGAGQTSLITSENADSDAQLVALKDVACYFALLEDGKPRDKLELVFRLYDADGNGVLDKKEVECIMNQVMNVAEYLGWDASEIRPVLQDMMLEIDCDGDGTLSLEKWITGGLTTLTLLILLGLDCNSCPSRNHFWKRELSKRAAFCNLCLNVLLGFGRKGLRCVLCRLIIHERCLQRSSNNCITTYSKTRSSGLPMAHHWVEGNCGGKCFLCEKSVRSYRRISGLRCRWCQIVLHNQCASEVSPVCTLGPNRVHIIPPTAIYPAVLDRHRGTLKEVEMAVEPCQPTFFRIESVPGTRPLLVLINPKSGGLQGAEIKGKFQYNLNPRQVYDLIQDDPMQALQLFKDVQNLRVICCGGDGTVGWILDMIDKSNFATHPGIGVVPLGTGNDLARCLQWGGGYEGEPISKMLRKIEVASMVMVDRWNVEIIADSPTGREPDWDYKTTSVMTNYFSVGVDAAICIKFHTEREKSPEKFNSRMKNKLWYFEFSTSEIFAASCRNLHQDVELECDGVPLDLANGQPLQGISILNIPSTHGGTNLWGNGSAIRELFDEYKERFERFRRRRRNEDADSLSKIELNKTVQDFGDRLIEVVGLESCLHMGQVRTGLRASGRRLAQCSTLTMRTKKRLPMQIDGEPWMQNPTTIKISHRCQVPMLRAPSSNEGYRTCCVLL